MSKKLLFNNVGGSETPPTEERTEVTIFPPFQNWEMEKPENATINTLSGNTVDITCSGYPDFYAELSARVTSGKTYVIKADEIGDTKLQILLLTGWTTSNMLTIKATDFVNGEYKFTAARNYSVCEIESSSYPSSIILRNVKWYTVP